MTSNRYFTVTKSSTGFTGGRFKGTLPSIAAKNAAKRVFKDLKVNTATFVITETARAIPKAQRGSFSYEVKRIKLPSPKSIVVTSKEKGRMEFTKKYDYELTPLGKTNSRAMSGGNPAPYHHHAGSANYHHGHHGGDGGMEANYGEYNSDGYDDFDDGESTME